MMFKPVLACKVLAGEKQTTRRIAPEGKDAYYIAGKTYPITLGRGARALAHMRVTHYVARITLGHISEEGAHHEGFFSVEGFERYWTELYGRYDPRLKVWLIHFELTTPPNTCPRCKAPVEWVLSPDETGVMALDAERSIEGAILVSMRRTNMAGTAVPQTPEEIAELRKQAATISDEEVRLFTEHRCVPA